MYTLRRPNARKWAYTYSQDADLSSLNVQNAVTVQGLPLPQYITTPANSLTSTVKLDKADTLEFTLGTPTSETFGGSIQWTILAYQPMRIDVDMKFVPDGQPPPTETSFFAKFSTLGGMPMDVAYFMSRNFDQILLNIRLNADNGVVLVNGFYRLYGEEAPYSLEQLTFEPS
jgi:hypothetical protein